MSGASLTRGDASNVNVTGNENQQKCGICDNFVNASPRYPNYACNSCQVEAVDQDGNRIDFFNRDAFGGFLSVTTVNDEKIEGENHICYIKNIKCCADEGRFGGIVIRPV